jgi:hypothetical protein
MGPLLAKAAGDTAGILSMEELEVLKFCIVDDANPATNNALERFARLARIYGDSIRQVTVSTSWSDAMLRIGAPEDYVITHYSVEN